MAKITKILVANRGEIALRIIRTAREMGITTVAVYSEADRKALHVQHADEAVYIGKSPSSESYLNIDKIVNAAQQTGANAIHPGYGFLSENEAFARRVQEHGLIFIGPSPNSIAIMGNKLASKAAVAKHHVPLLPGTTEPITNLEEGKKIASKIGYPVLLKASAGGGGKGMRIVEKEKDFEAQMERAMSEARSSFGDDSVFLEKFVQAPRHIEFQILGDLHGNIIHLFERECSIQRRHQKVVEEAPSSILTESLRDEMGKAAILAAKSCDYVGAGTVEFILDEKLNFFFLEMNTRLQVEHPVTEAITGLDLVRLQIQIAEGEKIPFKQEELRRFGHAIEVRVYAEDPSNNFLPDVGTLHTYRQPQGHGVRVDDGFQEGDTIPYHYDPMIAKLICHAQDRPSAIAKMIRAIQEYEITGLETTLGFCEMVMKSKPFTSGKFDTNFVEKHFFPEKLKPTPQSDEALIAALAIAQLHEKKKQQSPITPTTSVSQWKKNRMSK